MIIGVHNHKGGIGKTTITAHVGLRADQRGIPSLLVTLDRQGDLMRWFSDERQLDPSRPIKRGNITALYSPMEQPPASATSGFPLVVIDTPPEAGIPAIVTPDLWVCPVDNRTAIESLAEIVPEMTEKAPCYVVFYGTDAGGINTQRGLQEATRLIPGVEYHPEIMPHSPAAFRSQAYYRPVWDVPHGKGTVAHHLMVGLCDAILARAGFPEEKR